MRMTFGWPLATPNTKVIIMTCGRALITGPPKGARAMPWAQGPHPTVPPCKHSGRSLATPNTKVMRMTFGWPLVIPNTKVMRKTSGRALITGPPKGARAIQWAQGPHPTVPKLQSGAARARRRPGAEAPSGGLEQASAAARVRPRPGAKAPSEGPERASAAARARRRPGAEAPSGGPKRPNGAASWPLPFWIPLFSALFCLLLSKWRPRSPKATTLDAQKYGFLFNCVFGGRA